MPFVIAVLVFVVVTMAVFAAMSLFDERKAQARVLRDRLSTAQGQPNRPRPTWPFSAMKCSAVFRLSTLFCAAPNAFRCCKKCWHRATWMFAPETS